MVSKEFRDVVKVLEKHRSKLISKHKVKQMGVGYKVKDGKMMKDTVGISIFVTKKPGIEALRQQQIEPVPKDIEGIPTDIVEIPGGFRPRGGPDDSRQRPFSGGVATINSKVPATGTLGLIVKKTTNASKLYGLTNNHVGANEDVKGLVPAAAKKGEFWIQPGAHGGGKVPQDVIAKLQKWNKLLPSAPGKVNYYDVSIGEIVKESIPAAKAYEIMEIGPVKGMEDINLGDKVMKRGRTTLKTVGSVSALMQVVQINYSEHPCDFTEQVIITGDPQTNAFSQPGDSGSVIVSAEMDSQTNAYPAKALLYAGGESSEGIDYTIASPIKRIAKDFQLKI